MLYDKFLSAIIDKGLAAAIVDYADSPNRLKGATEGFTACRGLQPPQLHELLSKARERASHAQLYNAPIDTYWELRCFEAEVEWVCNCISVALLTLGQEPIVQPTVRAALLVNEIVTLNTN
jgi:hypothetical protein